MTSRPIARALLIAAFLFGCENLRVELQSQHEGSCRFAEHVTALSCTSDACFLCLDDGSCRWVTYRFCGP